MSITCKHVTQNVNIRTRILNVWHVMCLKFEKNNTCNFNHKLLRIWNMIDTPVENLWKPSRKSQHMVPRGLRRPSIGSPLCIESLASKTTYVHLSSPEWHNILFEKFFWKKKHKTERYRVFFVIIQKCASGFLMR